MTRRSSKPAARPASPKPPTPAQALDAAASAATGPVSDSYANFVTGLGVPGVDKSIHGALQPGSLIDNLHILHLYKTDFLARQIVDVPADDCTRPWRVWNGDAAHNAALFAEEERLRVRDRVRQALKHARLFGGGALVIHDGTEDLATPFEADKVRKGDLKALIVASRAELAPVGDNTFVQAPADPHYGLPEMWTYKPRRFAARGAVQVHHSRLVLLAHGDQIDDGTAREWWWGESALTPALSAVADASGARSAATHLMQEANVDVVRTDGLLNRMETATGREQLLKAAFLMKTSKSNFGLLMLDKLQEYSRNAYSFGGVKDIIEIQHALVAAAADIPITRLLGRSPAGMNATGESDLINYYAMLTSLQESMLSPCMAALDKAIILSALGKIPQGLWYDWRRPDALTEDQRIKHAETRAKTVKEYAATGLIPEPVMEEAVRSLLIETGDLPGAEAAYAKWDEAGNEIDFSDIDEPDPPAAPTVPPGGAPPSPETEKAAA
jgi:phage-related protein (TIGR01555 family)